jgi:hypothetical protein
MAAHICTVGYSRPMLTPEPILTAARNILAETMRAGMRPPSR